jgi:hypothetical protein
MAGMVCRPHLIQHRVEKQGDALGTALGQHWDRHLKCTTVLGQH